MITPGTRPIEFRLSEPARSMLLDSPVRWGHQGLSEVTFYRTYSRRKWDGTMESWNDCVMRVVEGQFTILKTHAYISHIPWDEARGQKLAREAAQRMQAFKWTPPGRGLWMMGTDYVWERGAAALNNCAFVSTENFGVSPDDTVAPFRFLMDVAMLGVGPGFDTRGAGKEGIRGYADGETTFRVPDTREGWVDAVSLVIRNGIYGGPRVTLDVQDVRPEGLPLRGFGGTSSGPVPLIQGAYGIADVLEQQRGRDLGSVVTTDVMNIIAKIVVSGNIRRTAEIGFAFPGDKAFANMKNWSEHKVETGNAPPPELEQESPEDYAVYMENMWRPETYVAQGIVKKYESRPWAYKFGGWRWASNNTVFEEVGADYSVYNRPITEAAEPGLGWLKVMQDYGRLKDPPNYKDHRVKGGNPCITGDTLIAVADGRNAVPIRELVGTECPVYTVKNGLVTIGKSVKTWLTRKNAEIWRLRLDDGSELRATPDHKIMLRNGTYVELKDLHAGESVMPFNSTLLQKGYRSIRGTGLGLPQCKQGHMIYAHNTGAMTDVRYNDLHHYDEDKQNDTFGNLFEKHRSDHLSEHKTLDNPMQRPGVAARVAETLRTTGSLRGQNNGMWGRKHGAETLQKMGAGSAANWAENREAMRAAIRAGVTEESRAKISAARRALFPRVEFTCPVCGKAELVAAGRARSAKVCSRGCSNTMRAQKANGTWNHKVVSVEFCGHEDVYDMTVADTHNFGVITSTQDDRYGTSSGLFVHNCLEQSLESFELCNLVEDYPAHCDDYWDFQRTLKFSYLYAKSVTLMGTHIQRTNEVMIRNRRIGCSMSGVAEAVQKFGRTHFMQEFCDRGYEYIGYLDRKYSEWLGVRESIKRTSEKPSGTVSLVAGVVGPGCHFPKPTGYRTMRIAASSPIVPALVAANYRTEPSVTDPAGTVVAYFPWLVPQYMQTEDVTSLWEQVKMAADMQYWWADNQVSYTATFSKEEGERGEIGRVLTAYDGQLKGISFLPKTLGAYKQMPFSTAPRDEVEAYAATLLPIDWSTLNASGEVQDRFCDGDKCTVAA